MNQDFCDMQLKGDFGWLLIDFERLDRVRIVVFFCLETVSFSASLGRLISTRVDLKSGLLKL